MLNRTRTAIALLMCAVLASTGCATAGAKGSIQLPGRAAGDDLAVLSDFVRQLPPGSAVRIESTRGKTLRGTLMKATAQSVILQPRTRIPEPPLEVALTEILSVTPESPGGHSLARAIAAGAAAGAGTAFAVFLIIVSAYAD
jgi:hypothetical protein